MYGDNPADEVELRLAPGSGRDHGGRAGARLGAGDGRDGLAGVGVGWDLALFALSAHLAGQTIDPTGLEQTPEYRRFVVLSSTAWGGAGGGGMATAAEAAAVVERTAAFYAPGVDEGLARLPGPAGRGGRGR